MSVQWYLLKTWVGKEEELAAEIRRTLPKNEYKECFVIYQERIWRKQQKSIVHVEPLFPGCVFLTCEQSCRQDMKTAGKKQAVPLPYGALGAGMIRSLRNEWFETIGKYGNLEVLPVMKEDAQFLESLSGKEHLVKLSYVQKDESGNICKLSAPLNVFQGEIERIQWKKRYAMVHHKLWGEEKVFVLGIVLNEDMESKVFYKNAYQGNALFVNSVAGECLAEEIV